MRIFNFFTRDDKVDMKTSESSPIIIVSPQRISQGYKLGYHKAAKMAEIAIRAEIWGVTGLAKQDMEQAFIGPFHEVQEALDKAIEKEGEKAKILFLMDASLTVAKGNGIKTLASNVASIKKPG